MRPILLPKNILGVERRGREFCRARQSCHKSPFAGPEHIPPSQNKMPATPMWNDTETDRSAWRAAHARKTRSKATRAGGRRIGGKRKVTRVSRERSESYVPNSLQGVFGADVAQMQDIITSQSRRNYHKHNGTRRQPRAP